MLRVHCTTEDLLRVTIAEHPSPLVELTQALQMLQRRDRHPVFGAWRRQLVTTLPPRARPILQLVSPLGAGPHFLDPSSRTMSEGLDQVLSTPRALVLPELKRMCAIDRPLTPWVRQLAEQDREAWRTLEEAIRAAYTAVLAEAWPRLLAGFHAETAWRARVLARDGLHKTLTGVCPSIRWRGMTFEADFPRDLDITLHGHGIVLQPSLLWADHLLAARTNGPLTLIYPVLTPLPLLDPVSAAEPLNALLGATRARALHALIQQRTTSELARELGVSLATASMQAKALRDAGLVVSHRDGKAVWHSCTQLGVDLLRRGSAGRPCGQSERSGLDGDRQRG